MPLTKDDLEAVKALVNAGRIEEARALLAGIDGDRAQAALVKFNERYPEMKAKAPRPAVNTIKLFAIGATLLLMAMVAVAGMTATANLSRQSEESMDKGRTQAAISSLTVVLEIICRQKFYDGVISQTYTEANLESGCRASIQNTLSVWPEQIAYCVDSVGLFASQLSECLDKQGVIILRSYVIQARDNPEMLQTPGQLPTLDWAVLTEFPGG